MLINSEFIIAITRRLLANCTRQRSQDDQVKSLHNKNRKKEKENDFTRIVIFAVKSFRSSQGDLQPCQGIIGHITFVSRH